MTAQRTLVSATVLLFSISLCFGACKKGPNAEETKQEAEMNVRRLADSSATYFMMDHTDADGRILPAQFPETAAMSPSEVPCGEPHTPSQDDWDDGETWTWVALNFAMSDPHYYAFEYESSGTRTGATFTATAYGDLDCDGELSTFVRTGHIEEFNEVVISDLESTNPLE